MARNILLRYGRCLRGDEAGGMRTARAVYPDHFETINKGSLKGCVRHLTSKPKPNNILKFGRGYVLSFRVVIRPGFPEELEA